MGESEWDQDIPGRVVISFCLALAGAIVSGIAGLVVFGDLLGMSAQEDLTDAAAPTIVGMAIPCVIGAAGGALAFVTVLQRQRLGRSMAGAAVVLGLIGVANLLVYAANLQELEDDLQEQVSSSPDRPDTDAPDVSATPTVSHPYPDSGLWIETTGDETCRWEIYDLGEFSSEGQGARKIVPSQISDFVTEERCSWEFAG
jgi:hypothetical protein